MKSLLCIALPSATLSFLLGVVLSCGDDSKELSPADDQPKLQITDDKPQVDDKAERRSQTEPPSDRTSDEELRSIAATSQSSTDSRACRDILISGVYNSHRETFTSSATQALRRNFCVEDEANFAEAVRKYYSERHAQSTGSSSSQAIGLSYMSELGLDFSTAGSNSASNSGELTTDDARSVVSAWKKKYCSVSESYSDREFEHYVQSSNIAPEVVAAWRACMTRIDNGFFCTSSNVGDLVSIDLRWDPSELQRRLMPDLKLKWQTVKNLAPVASALPDKIGTGSGRSVGFQRQGLHEAGLVQVTAQDDKEIVNFTCSLAIPAAIQLQFREDSSCGVDLYKLSTAPVCGIAVYKEGNGEVCGIASYQTARSPACGVELYSERRDAACGVASERSDWRESYKTVHQVVDTGYCAGEPRNCHPPVQEVKSYTQAQEEVRQKEAAGDLNRFCHENYEPGSGSDGWRITADRNDWRIEVNCHARTYQTCRHETFGIERYHACRDPSHGAEAFNTCRHPAFGAESYNTCRDESFGVERFQSCLIETRVWQ